MGNTELNVEGLDPVGEGEEGESTSASARK